MNAIYALLILQANCGAKAPAQLWPEVVKASATHKVDSELLARIIVQESRCNPSAVNKRTQDYGIAQINLRSHHITRACALDWRCGLHYGAKVLSKAKRPCNYNVGPKVTQKNKKVCVSYESRLNSLKSSN